MLNELLPQAKPWLSIKSGYIKPCSILNYVHVMAVPAFVFTVYDIQCYIVLPIDSLCVTEMLQKSDIFLRTFVLPQVGDA